MILGNTVQSFKISLPAAVSLVELNIDLIFSVTHAVSSTSFNNFQSKDFVKTLWVFFFNHSICSGMSVSVLEKMVLHTGIR